MSMPPPPAAARRRASGFLLALLLGPALAIPAGADDATTEREQLAAALRQLDWLDRVAEYNATLPRQEGARYTFDYARLREDIERMRRGIRDYLNPSRAQPRDPAVLLGDYRQAAPATTAAARATP